MFTGIIEEVGKIISVSRKAKLMDLTIGAKTIFDDIKIGDSISINGVCQTVVDIKINSFTVQAIEETLDRTTLGKMKTGDSVNLERALRINDRLGGHLVQGHIDGTGKITSRKDFPDNVILSVRPERGLEKYIVEKGSITIDGISLTVAFTKNDEFEVAVIPHTIKFTTLNEVRTGDIVNLETDIIAKYIEKLIGGNGSLTLQQLKNHGF
jgi:riboflavin synthase